MADGTDLSQDQSGCGQESQDHIARRASAVSLELHTMYSDSAAVNTIKE